MPIVEKLDPYGAYIPWKLYRESTRYKNKALCKVRPSTILMHR